MNSEIKVYRQKKVDQLLRNLNRCNKILENIQKIDTYIQQQGGNVANIQDLVTAVGQKRDAIKSIQPYSLPENTVLVSQEDIAKQEAIVEAFKRLAKAVSLLVNTQIKTQGGPEGAAENPFGDLQLDIQDVDALKQAYKAAVKGNETEDIARIKGELGELGYEDDYFQEVQREVEREVDAEEEARRLREQQQQQQQQQQQNQQGQQGQQDQSGEQVSSRGSQEQQDQSGEQVSSRGSQDQSGEQVTPRGPPREESGGVEQPRSGQPPRSVARGQQSRSVARVQEQSQERQGDANKYFYQNYF